MDDMEDMEAFLSRSPVYVELVKVREKIWQNSSADEYFRDLENQTDNATPKLQIFFFQMMRKIAKDMNDATQFITEIEVRRKSEHLAAPPKVLDLCMAPGGFTEELRQSISPLALINGITLPMSLGGHELLLKNSTRLNVEYMDITMLAAEMGFEATDIPLDHPDNNLFSFDRPFFDQTFDIVLCDGKVLRTQKRQEYREKTESKRLRMSQLVFAMQRIKCGGTFVMLLHKPDSSRSLNLIYEFHKFSSSVELFKPTPYHAMRSSFYLVAKGVNPQSVHALHAVNQWKKDWAFCTLHGTCDAPQTSDDNVQAILVDFGVKFIEMCEPIWKIQSDALSRNLKKGFKKLKQLK